MADNATPRWWDSIFDVPSDTVVADRDGDRVRIVTRNHVYQVIDIPEDGAEAEFLSMHNTGYQHYGPFTEVV